MSSKNTENTKNEFEEKWKKAKQGSADEEKSLFVEKGRTPITQRQLNLYYYFLFISRLLRANKAKNALEVGCGRGTMSLFLKEYMGLDVSLLDSSASALIIAKKEFEKNLQDAKFYKASALKTGLPANSFDAIISIGLIEHFENPDDLFKEQYRLLRKGGVIISLNLPKKFSIQILNNIMRVFKKIFGAYKEKVSKDYYRNSLKPKDYQKSAKRAGFKKVKTTNVCPFAIFTPVSIKTGKKITKAYKLILKLRNVFQQYPYKTNYLFSQGHFLIGYKI